MVGQYEVTPSHIRARTVHTRWVEINGAYPPKNTAVPRLKGQQNYAVTDGPERGVESEGWEEVSDRQSHRR